MTKKEELKSKFNLLTETLENLSQMVKNEVLDENLKSKLLLLLENSISTSKIEKEIVRLSYALYFYKNAGEISKERLLIALKSNLKKLTE